VRWRRENDPNVCRQCGLFVARDNCPIWDHECLLCRLWNMGISGGFFYRLPEAPWLLAKGNEEYLKAWLEEKKARRSKSN